jgi:Zn ribbon nucleic-acid-binding protein
MKCPICESDNVRYLDYSTMVQCLECGYHADDLDFDPNEQMLALGELS